MSSFWSTFRCVRRFEAIEAVVQADDGTLPRRRNLLYVVLELFRFALAIDALQNIVFRRHDVSISMRVLPSLSVSIGSLMEISCELFWENRKYIRTSFSMHPAV